MSGQRTNVYRIIILLLSLATSTSSFAQPPSDKPQEGVKPPKFGVSVNGGITFSYTDVKPSKTAAIFGIGGAYHALPYLDINLDLQKGWIKGGVPVAGTPNQMGSDNSFFTAVLTGRFMPLRLVNNKENNQALRILSGLYAGIGLGVISNSVKSNYISAPDFGSIGKYEGASMMLPVEAGINIPVAYLANNKQILINLNYRAHLCFSDKIDGYIPTVNANKKNDAYNTLTAGIMLNF